MDVNEQNRMLKQQQDAEFQEAQLMDQMKEVAEREKKEQDEQLARMEQERLAEEARKAAEEAAAIKAKAHALPPEPEDGDANKISLLFRLPDGSKKQRKFSKLNFVGHLYDYMDDVLKDMGSDLLSNEEGYKVVCTFPRKEYNRDYGTTLADAKLENMMALMVQKAH